jgi:5-formyltetrahydrofolate cyclo-ligase
MSIGNAKQVLREELLAARLRLTPEERAARSRELSAQLQLIEPFRRARTVAAYAAIGAEADPAAAVAAARASGARLVWPRLVPGARLLSFAACAPEELVAGGRGTRSPPEGAPEVAPGDIDCVLVPGVAFDAQGGRLGRGGGYYDATLAALPPTALRLGVAFDLQLVPRIPGEPHDVEVEAVVTESGVTWARGPRAGRNL